MLKILIITSLIFLGGCEDDELSKDPGTAYATAKKPYDDGDYDIAITKLGEFKARFPYSQYAVEAELLIANSQFELENYEDAAVSYSQFAKLHPKHPQLDFALYRVGESYWMLSPEEIDREQEFTHKAVEEFQVLINRLPNSSYSKKAGKLVKEGQQRIADSFEFVAKFYCKQELYHACAFRSINLAREYPQFRKMRKDALVRAANALDRVAEQKKADPKSDKNIYFNSLNAEQIVSLARKLRSEAKNQGTNQ
jgi:outer membrane protein assembly factor BamD